MHRITSVSEWRHQPEALDSNQSPPNIPHTIGVQMRQVSILLTATLISACGSSLASSASTGAGHAGSPANEIDDSTDVASVDSSTEAYEVSPNYGRSPTKPLEWGMQLADRRGSRNDITCPNGANASLSRRGSITSAPYESPSPACGFATIQNREGPSADVIDAYDVSCPGQPVEIWYNNPHRCGSRRPPRGFSFLPAAANNLMGRAMSVFQRGDRDGGIALGREALALAPNAERTRSLLGVLLVMVGQDQEARVHLGRALAARPDSPYHALHLAFAHQLENPDHYRQTVSELLQRLEETHALYPELQCRGAHVRRRTGEIEEAVSMAAEACAAGYARCCAFDPNQPPSNPARL